MRSEDVTIRAERADEADVTALLLPARALLAGLYRRKAVTVLASTPMRRRS